MRKSKALNEIEARTHKLSEELAVANANVHAIASRLDELEMIKGRLVSEKGFVPGKRSKAKAAIREKVVKQFNDTVAQAAQATQARLKPDERPAALAAQALHNHEGRLVSTETAASS